jgi:hypothetical protein
MQHNQQIFCLPSAVLHAYGEIIRQMAQTAPIGVGFQHMNPAPQLQPFEINTINREPNVLNFNYTPHIVSDDAPAEIDQTLDAYKRWKWP